MLFPRLIGLALTMLIALGCSASTAPPTRVTALYVLETIGGQPLPATFSPYTGETATIFWATLGLDPAGNATIVERRRTETATFQYEVTDARITNYEIIGETITVGPPCPNDPLALCVVKRTGQITGSTLTLTTELGDPNGPLYVYRLAATE